MPAGRPEPAPNTPPDTLIQQLYEVHRKADDAHLEQWPDSAVEVLRFTKRHHQNLPGAPNSPARTEQIRLRLELTRVVRAELDKLELDTLEQARPKRAHRREQISLHTLAEMLGVATPGAVSHRMSRLRAATNDPTGHRTPAHAHTLEQARTAEQKRREAELAAAFRHHKRLRAASLAVLRSHHDKELRLTPDSKEWSEELDTFANKETPTPQEIREEGLLLSLTITNAVATSVNAETTLRQAQDVLNAITAHKHPSS